MTLESSPARFGDAERELLRRLVVDAARPRRGPRGARAGLDQRHHGARVAAHRRGEPAGFDQDLAPLADAHHGAVDAAQHLQHARQAADVLFLAAAFGEVALAAAIAHDLPVLAQQQPACCASSQR